MRDIDEINQIKEKIFHYVKIYYEKNFNNKVKFIPGETQINYGGRVFDDKELIYLIDSSLDFWLTEGRYATQFQQKLANFIGQRFCILTNSGSSANLLAISALRSTKIEENKRLKPGDEIITVAAGFPTTIFPIIQNGAIPVFVDIELETCNIDTSLLEKALSKKTKAVFLAHTLGNPFNIENVKSFCDHYGLWFIEDNCDALGSIYNNRSTGSFGDISTLSFYPAHHITMGEGGALLTSNPLLNRIIRSLREWGRDCWCPSGKDNTCKKRFEWQLGSLPNGFDHKYTYSEFGYNLKITDMQAAIGLAQMKKLSSFVEARRDNHEKIFSGLKDFESCLILPKAQENSIPSWFGFLFVLRDSCKLKRTEIMKKLEEKRIQTRLLFAGNILHHPVFHDMEKPEKIYRIQGELINTDKVMNDSFWIGVYPGLTDDMINYMIKEVSELLV